MQLSTLLATCIVSLATYYVTASILAWRRLQEFKGPWLASFSYLYMAKSSFSGRGYKVWYDVSSKYGPLARIGPNDLLTDDPEIIRRLSATTSQYRRSSWYEPTRIDPYDHSMFSLRDNVAHDKLKGKTAAAYSGKENPALEAEVDYVLAELVDKIRTKYISTPGDLRPLDLAVMAQYFTLDSITKIAFGESFGFLSREEDVYHYLHTIESIAPVAAMTGEIPLLCSIVASPSVLRLAGPKKTDKSGIGKLMASVRASINLC